MKPENWEETVRRYRAQLLQYQSRRTPDPAKPAHTAPPAQLPAPPAALSFGTLVAAVTTAQEAVPVAGADVMLLRTSGSGAELLYFVETDRSGRTPAMRLAAPDASQSASPGGDVPYAVYVLRVFAARYAPAETEIRVFGGAAETAPISLIPSDDP